MRILYKLAFIGLILPVCMVSGCTELQDQSAPEAVEFFMLRPEVEKAYGYTHAVKIGNELKISGAVSMDNAGNPTAIGDIEEQMKNVYADLAKILAHFGYGFDDVIVENIFTTNMEKFIAVASYRSSLYTKHYPTGNWLEVKGLVLPEFMIEIEIEAYRANASEPN